MYKIRTLALMATTVLVGATLRVHAVSLSNLPWTGPDAVQMEVWAGGGFWGPTQARSAIGEFFQATASETTLDSVTFYVDDFGTGFNYTADVLQYSGPSLYTSATQTLPSVDGFQALTANLGGVTLTPGDYYFVYLQATGGSGQADFEAFAPGDPT